MWHTFDIHSDSFSSNCHVTYNADFRDNAWYIQCSDGYPEICSNIYSDTFSGMYSCISSDRWKVPIKSRAQLVAQRTSASVHVIGILFGPVHTESASSPWEEASGGGEEDEEQKTEEELTQSLKTLKTLMEDIVLGGWVDTKVKSSLVAF